MLNKAKEFLLWTLYVYNVNIFYEFLMVSANEKRVFVFIFTKVADVLQKKKNKKLLISNYSNRLVNKITLHAIIKFTSLNSHLEMLNI